MTMKNKQELIAQVTANVINLKQLLNGRENVWNA